MVKGSCHCGRIRLSIDAAPNEAIECNCSHCARKGMILTFLPRDEVAITAEVEDVGTYTFNKHAIMHKYCRTCGCQPYAEGEGKEGPTVAVNLRCTDLDLSKLEISKVDGKSF